MNLEEDMKHAIGGVTIVSGDGLLNDTIQQFGLESIIPADFSSKDNICIGLLSIWNQSSWSDIISHLRIQHEKVIVIRDVQTDFHIDSGWIEVSVPIIMEPLFYDVDIFQNSGDLQLFANRIEAGLCTLNDVFGKLSKFDLTYGGKFELFSDPISVEDFTTRLVEAIEQISTPEMISSILFSDLDDDNSGFIEASELLSISQKFTNLDVESFLQEVDTDKDNRIGKAEFEKLLSDSMVRFIQDSIPKVRILESNDLQRIDLLASKGYNTKDALQFSNAFDAKFEGDGDYLQLGLSEWIIRNASTLLGVKMIPSVGVIRTRSIRIKGNIGTYLVLFRPDSKNIKVRRTEDGKFFEAEIDNSEVELRLTWSKGRRSFTIGLDDNQRIISAKSTGVWNEQSYVLKNMIDGVSYISGQLQSFELLGTLFGEDESSSNPMICRCIGLDSTGFNDLFETGIENALMLKQKTGATSICGGCTSMVDKLFEDDSVIEVKKVGTMDVPQIEASSFESRPSTDKLREAEAFILQMRSEGLGSPGRLEEVRKEISQTGTWSPTHQELEWGARVSWRNSTRCIGRYFWETLGVRDARNLSDPEEIFQSIFDHINWATNNGEIRACMTVFSPADNLGIGPRLWNEQYIKYACHEMEDGTLLGDPGTLSLTKKIKSLGWTVENPTRFDVLPLVIELPGKAPVMKEIPKEIILEVNIRHPEYPNLETLGLKWYALPAVSAMSLEIGGLLYTLAPFNGFYMSTEIGARNFTDVGRYNLLEPLADAMGISRQNERDLWKDKVQVELNRAILYSFEQDGVRMMDHHSLSEWFLKFEENEIEAGREVHAEWAWIVPPIGASATPVYLCDHWENKILKPNLFYLPEIHDDDSKMGHGTPAKDSKSRCPFHND